MNACVLLMLAGVLAAPELVPNADFSGGGDAPVAWELVGGAGRWVDGSVLEVTGSGSDSCYWRCDDVAFDPGRLYRFQMRARRNGSAGSAIAGPTFANRDYFGLSDRWQWFGHVFRVPENASGGYLRLGHWHATGAIQFDAVRLTAAVPVYRRLGPLVLGEGESIRDGEYRFVGTFGHEGSNHHRTLLEATAGFNSDRWCFAPGNHVTYRFALPGCRLTTGKLSLNVNYHTRGGCVAEVSRDGKDWLPVASQNKVGSTQAVLPGDLFPAKRLLVRLRTAPQDSSFQVDRIVLAAGFSGAAPEGTGQTAFLDLESSRPGLSIEGAVLDTDRESGRMVLEVTAANTSERVVDATLGGEVAGREGVVVLLAQGQAALAPNESAPIAVEIDARTPGEHEVTLELAGTRPDDGRVQARLTFTVPDFARTDYGRLVDESPGRAVVWWCDATRKIPRRRAAPSVVDPTVKLAAARNDFEAVQIVVRPDKPLRGLRARIESKDENGFSAENVEVLRVFYHFVDHPTDATGVRDWWPDALPPADGPVDVPAAANQPFWVLFHVPDEAAVGDHDFELALEADGFSARVPVRLHVWDFALPGRNHIETAFGLTVSDVFRYHGLKTEADKRKVLDMYFQSFAEHRMSPYDPTPLDPIRVRFDSEAERPHAEVDFSAFDRAMEAAVEKFGFTNFRLPVQGMGGGTFHRRYEPKIGQFTEETPEYQAMFSSYVKQLESHLREKGWLDMAYIYWFDEPDPKDYAFVRGGMQRLKRYAPGLTTMLTEQPSDPLAGPVDVWCPVSFHYDHEAAEARRAAGERFWWYVCCGPKAPYCTLFIDHPASELRVWLWQSFQRDVRGVLVWRANYWTSSAAFPDAPQNPYDDPMGYRSGYSTPKGTKAFWGNGDGRFLYPPLAAAVPSAAGQEPVIEPPVSSIRWEMLREGIEDYEMLTLLAEHLDAARGSLSRDEIKNYEGLLEVPDAITADMTTFTTDPAPIYARRRAVAEAIEQLSERTPGVQP